MADPNVELLNAVAIALGELRDQMVFVGGCATSPTCKAEAPRNSLSGPGLFLLQFFREEVEDFPPRILARLVPVALGIVERLKRMPGAVIPMEHMLDARPG